MQHGVDDVAAFILEELGSMDTFKLEKLVYYSQAWHLAITDQPLFSDPILAFKNGPVVDRLYQAHKRQYRVSSWPQGDKHGLSGSASEIVKMVCATYGSLDGDALSKLTHTERPWLTARGTTPESAPSREVGTWRSMADFYREQRLGDRFASDLASGGVFLKPPAWRVDTDVLQAALGAVVADLDERVGEPPAGAYVGRGQFERPQMTAPGTGRGRSRTRPED